ncbi:MAG TPA: ATP-binding protein [Elusimicrobiota bacterium]|nr:ATP-binding protein [Elusimicrobiota bacterium]
MTQAVGGGLLSRIDGALSALLRYDLSRKDVVKWVLFARQLLMVLLFSVVTIAGLSAYLSTRQAKDLLRASLASEARAIADSVARASFVPLTLDDDRELAALVDSYRSFERVGSLRVLDAGGVVRAALPPPPPRERLLLVRVPVRPLPGEEPRAQGGALIGFVEVGMRRGSIDARIRAIAATNVAVAGGLTIVVWILGLMIIRNLIDRTRELIGEARMAEEVKRANAELEAFSYSVAHDLRAPLRAVDGFSQALLAGYSDKMDEQAKHYLARLRENSLRMGQLINDLLSLSRVTRGELRREDFDLADLARQAAARLRRSQPDREVEFVIPPSLPVNGDPSLMLAALENLLGNAWKYTSRKGSARIELGLERRDGTDVYFVRDDGAGFDMAFSAKLFKPFSRLHSPGEFEGTGIGLATVQRIVERHGGRIWGEGRVGAGATFYFTLGESA